MKLETSRVTRRVLRSRSQRLALIGAFVAIYVVLVEVLPFISYGQINVRVADALYGLAPIFPAEVLLAAPLATFLSDTTSYMGAYDFIGSSCVIAISMFSCVQVQRRFSIFWGFVVFDLILSTWLSWLVWYVGTGRTIPFLVIAAFVFVGNVIAEIILPFTLYKVMKGRLHIGTSAKVSPPVKSENA